MAVYFAQENGGGLIKIGFSADVEGRVRVLKLGLLTSVPGALKTERFIHQKFAHLRVSNEWFRPESELLEFIAKPEVPEFDEEEKPARSVLLVVRVSEEERDVLEKHAAVHGLPVSSWARMILFRTVRHEKEEEASRADAKAGDQPADTVE